MYSYYSHTPYQSGTLSTSNLSIYSDRHYFPPSTQSTKSPIFQTRSARSGPQFNKISYDSDSHVPNYMRHKFQAKPKAVYRQNPFHQAHLLEKRQNSQSYASLELLPNQNYSYRPTQEQVEMRQQKKQDFQSSKKEGSEKANYFKLVADVFSTHQYYQKLQKKDSMPIQPLSEIRIQPNPESTVLKAKQKEQVLKSKSRINKSFQQEQRDISNSRNLVVDVINYYKNDLSDISKKTSQASGLKHSGLKSAQFKGSELKSSGQVKSRFEMSGKRRSEEQELNLKRTSSRIVTQRQQSQVFPLSQIPSLDQQQQSNAYQYRHLNPTASVTSSIYKKQTFGMPRFGSKQSKQWENQNGGEKKLASTSNMKLNEKGYPDSIVYGGKKFYLKQIDTLYSY